MARGRFPSDEARKKTKSHAKIHLRARTHRKTQAAFEDPETRGIIVGLWMLAAESHANKTGNVLCLTNNCVRWLTGRERLGNALARLRQATGTVSYRTWQENGATFVDVRNYAEKQGLPSAARVIAPRPLRETPPSEGISTEGISTDSSSESSSSSVETSSVERYVARSRRSAPSLPDWSIRLSKRLIEGIREAPGGRIPPGAEKRWAKEIARIPKEVPTLAANGTDPEAHIAAGIEFAFSEDNLGREYEVVIRSGKSLREKWAKLTAASQRSSRSDRETEKRQQGIHDWIHGETT